MVPRGLPDMTGLLDPNSLQVLEQLKLGKITIRQAAELLKVEPALLAYEFAAKVNIFIFHRFFGFFPFVIKKKICRNTIACKKIFTATYLDICEVLR